LGTFYVASLPAELLLKVAFADVMNAKMKPSGEGYDPDGTQRIAQPRRVAQIANYIDRADSAFPNSIILAANYRP
jgi:DGQHR domain-containing protein